MLLAKGMTASNYAKLKVSWPGAPKTSMEVAVKENSGRKQQTITNTKVKDTLNLFVLVRNCLIILAWILVLTCKMATPVNYIWVLEMNCR
jgi:hypothetical protein